MRLMIALVVWAAAVIGAVFVSTVVADGIHNRPASSGAAGFTSSFGSTPPSGFTSSNDGGSASAPDPSSITSTDKLSLFRTANLERALARARSALGSHAKLDNFALYPGYLSITAVKGNGEVDFYVDANGRVIQTNAGGSPDGQSLFSLDKVQADGPAALSRRISSAGHVPASKLHYMVLDLDPLSNGKLEWLVYTVGGSHVEYFKAPGAKGTLLEYRTNSSTGLQPVSG